MLYSLLRAGFENIGYKVSRCLNGWNHNAVSNLFVGLSPRHWKNELLRIIALQLHGFLDRKAPRAIAGLLNQNLGPVLVITR